jgi:TetR/AcrR family transcriptional repressor of nem operon
VKDDGMPYSPEHKQDTRERILESARRLFNSKGFSEFSIEEVMTHAGPTHGGFYRHFSGKDEVYAEAVRHFVCKRIPGPWQAKQSASGAGKTCAERIVDAYFWRDHFDDRECCCPLHGMASNVSCSGEAVKAAYHEVAERAVRVLEAHLSEPEARERAFRGRINQGSSDVAELCGGGYLRFVRTTCVAFEVVTCSVHS